MSDETDPYARPVEAPGKTGRAGKAEPRDRAKTIGCTVRIVTLAGALILGAAGTFIPWGSQTGFHGVGFPFAQVYWDRGLDYPNPLALFENMLLAGLLSLIFWGLGKLVRWVWRWSRQGRK